MDRQEDRDTFIFPRSEETATVSKRVVETGRVRIKKSVVTETETVAVPTMTNEVEVQRIAKNEILAELPQARYVDDVYVIPVVEETWVLEKRLLLKEEIHIRNVTRMDEEIASIELMKERIDVDREEMT